MDVQYDWIHIDVEKPEKLGSLDIPDTVRDDMEEEIITVINCGPDVERCEKGDRLIVRPGTGIRVPHDGKMVYFCRESDLLAVIRKEEADG